MGSVVGQFLLWARHAQASRREEAARMLARSYLVSPLSPEEREEVEAAMTVLLDDPAAGVRMALAHELGTSELAPHHVILALSADSDSIAAHVAAHSPVLLDSELVDMTAKRSEPVQVAIASRPYVSRAVCAAIGEVGSVGACTALVRNTGARILRFSLDRMVERHGDCAEFRLALLDRTDLPIEVRHILLGKLAAALRELVVAREWVAAPRAETLIRDARETATIAIAFEAPADTVPALVAQMIAEEELTPAFLIRAVAAGQAHLFEAGIAALSRVPRRRVRSLIAAGRAPSLRALFQKARLPARTHPVLIAAIDVLRTADLTADGSYRRATQLIDTILARYQERPDRELDQILALLRRFARDAKRSAAREYVQQVLEAA
jgi:uncharacterized protein (DUF2336 family)